MRGTELRLEPQGLPVGRLGVIVVAAGVGQEPQAVPRRGQAGVELRRRRRCSRASSSRPSDRRASPRLAREPGRIRPDRQRRANRSAASAARPCWRTRTPSPSSATDVVRLLAEDLAEEALGLGRPALEVEGLRHDGRVVHRHVRSPRSPASMRAKPRGPVTRVRTRDSTQRSEDDAADPPRPGYWKLAGIETTGITLSWSLDPLAREVVRWAKRLLLVRTGPGVGMISMKNRSTLVLLLAGWSATALNSHTAEAQGFPPEEAARRMSVAEGLEVRLVAAEPLVRQPVAIEFDDRGPALGHPVPAVSQPRRAQAGGGRSLLADRLRPAFPSRRRAGPRGPIASRSWRTPMATAAPTAPTIS